MNARCMSDVDGCVFDAGTIFCRLSNRIHFGMDGAKAVLLCFSVGCFGFIYETADVGTMGHTRRRAVISRGKDIFIAYDHRANFSPCTGRSLMSDLPRIYVAKAIATLSPIFAPMRFCALSL